MNKICTPDSKILCDRDICDSCDPRRFSNHPKFNRWSPKNIQNPRLVTYQSNKKYIFYCDVCKHNYTASVCSLRKNNCPYCSSRSICDSLDCEFCFDKSFQSHIRAKDWSPKNKLTPRQVFKSSGLKFIFNCHCGHDFICKLNNISENEVLYCSTHVRNLCDDDNCQNCYNRSFQSHPKSQFWSIKNKLTPRQIFKSTADKYIFYCDKCKGDFEIGINRITSGNRWCNKCKKKTEAKLYKTLKDYAYDVKEQFWFDSCRNIETNRPLPFDFLIEEYKIIIELDGNQHFKQVSNWRTPDEQHRLDLYKMECANKDGYTIIRIYQEDVLFDRINWWEKIENNIYLHDSPTRVFISSGTHYDCFNL